MPVKVTDDEFITCWKRFGSPVEVAKALAIDLRGVYSRRKAIEGRYSIRLETLNDGNRGRPKVEVPKQGFRAIKENIKGFVMVGGDGHFWPGERSPAFDAFINLIPELKPSMIIMNGDSFDGSRISRHPPGGWAKMPDVAEELAAVQERHSEIEAIARKAAR